MNIKAQAAKNLSGLIRKIESYNETTISQKTVKVNVSNAINQVQTLLNKLNALPKTKTVRINVSQSGSNPGEPRGIYSTTPMSEHSSSEPNKIALLSEENTSATREISLLGEDNYHTNNVSLGSKRQLSCSAQLENQQKKTNKQIEFIDINSQKNIDEEKIISYLEQQVELLIQQRDLQELMSSEVSEQKNNCLLQNIFSDLKETMSKIDFNTYAKDLNNISVNDIETMVKFDSSSMYDQVNNKKDTNEKNIKNNKSDKIEIIIPVNLDGREIARVSTQHSEVFMGNRMDLYERGVNL